MHSSPRFFIKETMKRTNEKGFTLMELLIVLAIIAILIAIAIPTFSSQMEKSREATDLANVRSAYAELMVKVNEADGATPITVELKQKTTDWQTKLPITIAGITYYGTDTQNWKGTPVPGGTCAVSYDSAKGVIFTWGGTSGGDAGRPIRPAYTGDLKDTRDFLKGEFDNRDTKKMQNNEAFFSNQKFNVNGVEVTARVYYADSPVFKAKLENYTPKPASYDDLAGNPFYLLEKWHGENQTQGFAYYTYGENGSIKEFTYVNSEKVYQTTDGGKTWYDITPEPGA